jgi:primosomal protein N' (replication factor Y) (superfamily II helicase)
MENRKRRPERQPTLFAAEEQLTPWERDERDDCLLARVVFSEGLEGEFDYLVPEPLRVHVEAGRRVRVPLGRGNRQVTAYCVSVGHASDVPRHRLKEITRVIDDLALISPRMLELTRWLADYYLCSWGTAIESAVPAGVRGQAGTREAIFLSVSAGSLLRAAAGKLSPKQKEILEHLRLAKEAQTPQQIAQALSCSLAPIQTLRKRRFVEESTRRVVWGESTKTPEVPPEKAWQMNEDQQRALAEVRAALHSGTSTTLLLKGVTGSGKTEVYIRAIEEVLRFGRQAIVLVPEISLTPQTEQRFRARFESVAVLHSHQSASERHWHWRRIVRGEATVIVGARSAVFAPTPQLGLIVIDEEHDHSFKQDTAPRYHARQVAWQRCQTERAPLILGSATPSLDSYQATFRGEYQLLELPRRVTGRELPPVRTIDLRVETRQRGSHGAISRPLHQAMYQALQQKGQVILLLNRRGYATQIQCPACGHAMKCPDCDISLTHHRDGEVAVCHYCDYQIPAPSRCPECGFEGIRYGGLGTQRLESEVQRRFPQAVCLRMDSDTMRKPGSHEQALARFRRGEVHILLGTQMIAKGLDFPNVTVVGVVNADMTLNFPNFRAAEQTFQLVTQVAGRTGRGQREGQVIVQTFNPEHPAILAAARHDYVGFASQELPNRERFGYPPFGRLVRIILRGEDVNRAEQFAEQLADRIRERLEGTTARLVGPAPAPLAKLRGKYRFHFLLTASDLDILREAIRTVQGGLEVPEGIQWVADVDPLDML